MHLDKGESQPMRTRYRRAAPGLGLALALGLTAAGPAWAQTSAPAAPASPSAPAPPAATSPATPPRAGSGAPLRLTLPEATALALRQQPTIRSAQGSLTAAQSRVPQARSFYFPRFDLQAGVQTSEFRSATTNNRQRSESTFATVTGRQLIYDFGKTSALVDEAQAGSRVASGELERVRDLVVQNVRQSYFNLLQARRLVGVADAALSRSELNLRSARGFFDVGTKPKSDVTRAEVEVANARVDVIRARNLVRLAETSLANALGLEATAPIEIDDILTYEPVALDSSQLLAEALGNRPELRQSQSRLDAARAQLAGARARYLPDLTVNGSAGMSSDDAVVSTDGVAGVAFADTWSISGQLTWNLFEGFFTQNRVKETQALVETARANYDTVELQVRLEVEQAYIAVTESAERYGATEKAVESAQENLRLAQGRYDAGVGTILELTEAQLSLTNAEADSVRAVTDYRVGLAVLDRVVGRP
jgi:TolC family type I secretion outer membrane protein